MLDTLRAYDRDRVELECGEGSVIIPPKLQGRIFCQLHGELIHRLDTGALLQPSPTEYNNLGGNSLWPAPEGGPFAFNYLPGSDAWLVQEGIANAEPTVRADGNGGAIVEKNISLTNRKGVRVKLVYRRVVSSVDVARRIEGYDLTGMAYATEDIWEPRGDYSPEEVLLAPWSLEQFPGAEGIVAFGTYEGEDDPINSDFYGDPGERLVRKQGTFEFRLGGKDRHQIGIKVSSRPHLIGALDPRRSLLLLRKTKIQEGIYFNIADNDQAAGPFSAADAYSIFNGGELGFFELETVGAMQVQAGKLVRSALASETVILRGAVEELERYLAEQEGVELGDG